VGAGACSTGTAAPLSWAATSAVPLAGAVADFVAAGFLAGAFAAGAAALASSSP